MIFVRAACQLPLVFRVELLMDIISTVLIFTTVKILICPVRKMVFPAKEIASWLVYSNLRVLEILTFLSLFI